MKKQMIIMLIAVGLLFGMIFGWKAYKTFVTRKLLASMQQPAVTVSTMRVESSLWQPLIKAVGTLRSHVGVNVTTELAGMVQTIYFTPGSKVEKGAILVQLNAATELAQLHALQAQVELAKITYSRNKAQFAAHAVSKQTVDTDEWNLKNLQAQLEQQIATTEKKTIRAPFSGFLGVNNVDPGQYLNVGDSIATLQSLDPMYADFYLPQQKLALLKVGQVVSIVSNTFPKKTFRGKITTIQPLVDEQTRNVLVEANVSNPDYELKPGMFVTGEIAAQSPRTYLTLPQSAITFNSYGDIVYLVKNSGKTDKNNQPILIVEQVFVEVGETRGDQIAILKGLKWGDIVVTSGQLKLKNGSRVVINNKIQPSNQAAPKIIEQ